MTVPPAFLFDILYWGYFGRSMLSLLWAGLAVLGRRRQTAGSGQFRIPWWLWALLWLSDAVSFFLLALATQGLPITNNPYSLAVRTGFVFFLGIQLAVSIGYYGWLGRHVLGRWL